MSAASVCDHCQHRAALAEKLILTPAEAAVLLGRSRSWVEAKIATGLLPGVRDGSRWIVRRADLLRDGWLAPDRAHEREARQ